METPDAELIRLRDENALLRKLLDTDVLTGIPNRRAMTRRLEGAMREDVSVLMIDIDHFKRINDTRGHAAGDRVLQEVAVVLQVVLRESDFLARMGGEEFMVILPTSGEVAQGVAERLRKAVEVAGYTVSIGLWMRSAGEVVSEEEASGRADKALYAAKAAGRNCVRVWVAENTVIRSEL